MTVSPAADLTIVNHTTEAIPTHAGPDLQTVLLGPSTPMVSDVFTHLPIHVLAGSTITDRDRERRTTRTGAFSGPIGN